MSRSKDFSSPVHQRIVRASTAPPDAGSIRGPLPFLNPTRARFPIQQRKTEDVALKVPEGAQIEWRARDNRKGRHILVLPHTETSPSAPKPSNSPLVILQGIWRMCTEFAWYDVSWWIGVLFSVGSAIFVMCACFYWVPLVNPSTEFPKEGTYAGGITSFIGATLFEIGAVLLIVEAVNENQVGCFGWAVESALFDEDGQGDLEGVGQSGEGKGKGRTRGEHEWIGGCLHHHRRGLHRSAQLQHPEAGRKWEWWPTWHELRTHYIWEIGFLASFTEAIGATVFYICGIMSLPGIYDRISTPVLWGTYWLAYLVGGILFVVASVLYMLETQTKWYLPAPTRIGWWIGLWNLVGSVGWTLSASFGYCSASWCAYQGDLSLLWASITFLVGSLLLWYEALDKYPVKRAKAWECP